MSLSDEDNVVDIAQFRRVVGSFATGVTIVTTVDSNNAKHGLTANSFTSVSLEPPLVLICLDHQSRSLAALKESGVFAVNIVSESQRDLSMTFASSASDKFDGVETFTATTGAAISPDSVAWLDCRMTDIIAAGDHDVVVGQVVDMDEAAALPLGYYRGSFFNVSDEQSAPDIRGQAVFGVIVEYDANVLLCRNKETGKWSFPAVPAGESELPLGGLTQMLRKAGVPTALSFLYSVAEIPHNKFTMLLYRGELSEPPRIVDRDNWKFLDAGDVPWNEISDYETEMTLKRYLKERSSGRFGLFADTGNGGHIAPIVDDLKAYSKEDADRELIAYDLFENWQVSFEAKNITGEDVQSYLGIPERIRDYFNFGRRYFFGVRTTF